MTDQTRWGIDQVQVKNKAIKYQKDLVCTGHGTCGQDGRIRDHGPYDTD